MNPLRLLVTLAALPLLTGMAPPPEGKSGPEALLISMAPILFIIVIFYFLMIRPQQKKAKQQQEMLKSLSKGDNVVTSSGIHARIAQVTDDILHLEIADRVVIRVNRDQVSVVKEKRQPDSGKTAAPADKK